MNQGPSTAATTAEPNKAGNAFLDLLRHIRPELESRITRRFEEKATRARAYGAPIAAMIEAAQELTMRGGKRMRAGLIAAGWIAAAGDASLDAAIDGGVAFELLQTYLLIQDDWMDGDRVRRGGPSVHVLLEKAHGDEKLGAVSAILASDMTWALAVETLTSIEALPAERRIETLKLFLSVHDDVVIGQQIDVLGKAEDIEAMHDLKTGSYTLRGPLLLGATLGGGSKELREGLTRFAAPLGIAFQLRDDLLGAFGDTAETGKPVGADIIAGKRTALIGEASRLANEAERDAIARAHGKADADAETVAKATSALVTSGARQAVEQRQHALCDEASRLLRSMDLAPKAQAILQGVVDALRVRRSETGASS